ncbi:MAG: hypothetical protein ACE37F_34870 [Nannocystaceae bacterium]|nr:hypothetical protein [bacterium]
MTDWLRARARPLLAFVFTFGVLASIAGETLMKPSANNHFVHMASGWLEGRLHHEGKPPGYCDAKRRRARKCRYHRFDDWAVLKTLELDDGTRVQGYPCRTQACADARRAEGVETWYLTGQGWTNLERGSFRRREETWFVSFPPGPAALLLPFVAVFGLATPDVLLTAIAAAFLPVVLLGFLDRTRGSEDGKGTTHLLIALAVGLGSPACFLGASGSVWFTAQILGALALMAFVSNAWELHRPALAGVCLGVAVACRPTMAVAVLFFGWEWWRTGRSIPALVRFVGPVLLIGAALMALNLARFEDPFEFGHRFLEIRWQPRIQQYGLFHPRYLGRNLECLLWLMPKQAWPLRVSLHGTALWLLSPWVLLVVLVRGDFGQKWGLVLTVAALMLPALLYQNSGQTQPTYRFAMLWLPVLVPLLAHGSAFRFKRATIALVVLSVLLQSWAAWMFVRNKGELFVTDPLGWPFEHEFEDV